MIPLATVWLPESKNIGKALESLMIMKWLWCPGLDYSYHFSSLSSKHHLTLKTNINHPEIKRLRYSHRVTPRLLKLLVSHLNRPNRRLFTAINGAS